MDVDGDGDGDGDDEWQTDHEWVGACVRRVIRPGGTGANKVFDGTIVGWDPTGFEDVAPLFHVKHNDGDSEDLEEHEAKAAMAVFSFEPRPGGDDWKADHLWVGKRVRRTTAGTTNDGTIVAWDPTGFQDEPPEPLFHVVHDDGDEEDLEEHEAKAAILAAAVAQAEASAKAEGLTLEPSTRSDNKTGYDGVTDDGGGRFRAQFGAKRKLSRSGTARTTRPRRRRSHAHVRSRAARHRLRPPLGRRRRRRRRRRPWPTRRRRG